MARAARSARRGMILVGDRRAEQRHDPVAEELVDAALVGVHRARMTSKARSMMAWTSSGSRRSDRAVNPDTSVNMTVTCLRSPSIALRDVRIFSARCIGV